MKIGKRSNLCRIMCAKRFLSALYEEDALWSPTDVTILDCSDFFDFYFQKIGALGRGETRYSLNVGENGALSNLLLMLSHDKLSNPKSAQPVL